MIITTHRDPVTGDFKEELVSRQNLKEWLIFESKWRFEDELKKLLGWQFKLYKGFPEHHRAIVVYWIWPLALWPLSKQQWWNLGRYCAHQGWFRSLPEPGTMLHWFWPKYFLPCRDQK